MTITEGATAASLAGAELVRLLAWFSPALPIGAYSHSHALEAAIEAELVTDAATLEDYVATALRFGGGRLDALLLAAAHRATRSGRACGDGADLEEIAITAAAMRGSRELALESAAQGLAMLQVVRQVWPAEALERLAALTRDAEVKPAQAVVAGVATAAHGLPLAPTLIAFLHGFVANLVSAGVRLVPLGQTDGQRVTAALEPSILEVAAAAIAGSIDDLGSAAPMIDLLSMAHETQYTRLFRS